MPDFDKVADIYDATRSLRPDVMSRAVEALLSQFDDGSVLDFGVGTGRYAAPLVERGVNLVGVDIAPRMIRQALSKGVAGLLLADAKATPFRDQSFDYALAVHFIHLVEDWRAVVREMARVSRGGLVTLIEDQQGARPRDIYLGIRERMGYQTRKLRLGERELVAMVPPATMEEAARYEEIFEPEETLEEYSRKLHSATWEVPDDINARIVKEMAPELGERRVMRKRLVLARWTREQLQRIYLTT